MEIRSKLEQLNKKTITIEGVLDRKGQSRSGNFKLCLIDVKDVSTGEILTDHLWINETSDLRNLFLEVGDTVRITGDVFLYKKTDGFDFGLRNLKDAIKKEDVPIYFAIPVKGSEEVINNKNISRNKFHICPTDALADFRVNLTYNEKDGQLESAIEDEPMIIVDPAFITFISENVVKCLKDHFSFNPLAKVCPDAYPSCNFIIIELKVCSFDISKHYSRYIIVRDLHKIKFNRYVTVNKSGAIYRKDFFKERFVERLSIDYMDYLPYAYADKGESIKEVVTSIKDTLYASYDFSLRARDFEFIDNVKWSHFK